LHNSLLHLLLKNGDFWNTDISQCSVVTRLWCGGVFVCDRYKFSTKSNSERILKIGQHWVKLWAGVRCLVFFDSQCSLVQVHVVTTFDNDSVCKMSFPLVCNGCLELTAKNCPR